MSKVLDAWDQAEFETVAAQRIAKFRRKDILAAIRESRYAMKLIKRAEGTKLPHMDSGHGDSPLRVVTILHASLPHHTGGYTGRAQGLLKGLLQSGVEIRPYTRPGFYAEKVKSQADDFLPDDVVDGVTYRHLPTDFRRGAGEFEYMFRSIDWYRQILLAEEPDVVHVRSTYLIALPALIAAHELAIPVLYEVSGLWELVYEGRGALGRARRTTRLENVTCAAADQVVSMNQAMADLLEERGGKQFDVGLVPNAVDTTKFSRTPALDKDSRFKYDVGYVGSLVDYEGIDILLEAIERIKSEFGREIRAKIVGSGTELERLSSMATRLGIADHVDFLGRVPAEEAARQFDDVNVIVLPRVSTPATEIVTPLKPFEAMAAGRPLIVSDVGALKEVSDEGRAAMVFESGNADGLKFRLLELLDNRDLQMTLAGQGQELVRSHHNWTGVAKAMEKYLAEVSHPRNRSFPYVINGATFTRVGKLAVSTKGSK